MADNALPTRKSRWFYFTFLIGLAPYFMRCLSGLFRIATDGLSNYPWGYLVAPADIVAFGMVLNISIINESLDLHQLKPVEMQRNVGIAIFSTILLSAIYLGALVIEGNVSKGGQFVKLVLFWGATGMTLWSTFLTYNLYRKAAQ